MGYFTNTLEQIEKLYSIDFEVARMMPKFKEGDTLITPEGQSVMVIASYMKIAPITSGISFYYFYDLSNGMTYTPNAPGKSYYITKENNVQTN